EAAAPAGRAMQASITAAAANPDHPDFTRYLISLTAASPLFSLPPRRNHAVYTVFDAVRADGAPMHRQIGSSIDELHQVVERRDGEYGYSKLLMQLLYR